MHEMAVCQALLQQLERVAAENESSSVRSATIRIGPLSGIVPELLQRAFEFARGTGVARSAELIVETSPVGVLCRECGARTEAAVNRVVCGACGGYRTKIIEGDELLLSRVELEGPPQPGGVRGLRSGTCAATHPHTPHPHTPHP